VRDENAVTIVMHHMDLFERGVVSAKLFAWKYFETLAGRHRATLWRDVGVRNRYREVKARLVRDIDGSTSLTSVQKRRASDQQRIRMLESDILGLRKQLEVAQARLVEMQVILADRNIDPSVVLEKRLRKHPHE
jgi:hypothetical protein